MQNKILQSEKYSLFAVSKLVLLIKNHQKVCNKNSFCLHKYIKICIFRL